jgi:hypothetical protein
VNAGKIKAQFIEPMECLPVSKLPEGTMWTWEIKLDGWRMEVVKTGGRVTLYSRRGKSVKYITRMTAADNLKTFGKGLAPRRRKRAMCGMRASETSTFLNCVAALDRYVLE